jgi:hypothetical protein
MVSLAALVLYSSRMALGVNVLCSELRMRRRWRVSRGIRADGVCCTPASSGDLVRLRTTGMITSCRPSKPYYGLTSFLPCAQALVPEAKHEASVGL